MIRKHHVRFGGGPGEKGCQQYLACGLPYMERMGESFETLAEMMGKEQAIQIVAETLQEVPEQVTRQDLLQVLLHELGDSEATQQMLDSIRELWETYDLLTKRFGPEAARKIIDAPVSLPTKEGACS